MLSADGVTAYHAVVCGIADYPGTVNDLDYTDDDARDFIAALESGYNWESSNITLLLDSEATTSNIEEAIAEMGNSADADDVCVFFFSGHGTYVDDQSPYDESDGYDECLCAYDGYIYDDDLGGWLNALPTSDYVAFLDACYSGGQIKNLDTDGQVKNFSDPIPISVDGFAEDLIVSNALVETTDLNDNGCGVVMTACDDVELSYEYPSLRNGVFTYYLVEAMSAEGDADGNGWVSAEEVYEYLAPRTYNYRGKQNPQLYDGHDGQLDFLQISPAPSVSITTNDTEVTEESEEQTLFVVSRTGEITDSLSVSYTLSGTATNGIDYSRLSGTIVIPAGQAQATIALVPLDDAEDEGEETVELILQADSDSDYTIATGSATVSITDDDAKIPGDANGDGRVDGSDVTIVASNWQAGVKGDGDASWSMGDFNGDGKVDGSDITILASNWQAGISSTVAAVSDDTSESSSDSDTKTSEQTDAFVPPTNMLLGVATVPRREELPTRRILTSSTELIQATDVVLAQSSWMEAETTAIAKDLAVASAEAKAKSRSSLLSPSLK